MVSLNSLSVWVVIIGRYCMIVTSLYLLYTILTNLLYMLRWIYRPLQCNVSSLYHYNEKYGKHVVWWPGRHSGGKDEFEALNFNGWPPGAHLPGHTCFPLLSLCPSPSIYNSLLDVCAAGEKPSVTSDWILKPWLVYFLLQTAVFLLFGHSGML